MGIPSALLFACFESNVVWDPEILGNSGFLEGQRRIGRQGRGFLVYLGLLRDNGKEKTRSFSATWWSKNQDNAGAEVFGQRAGDLEKRAVEVYLEGPWNRVVCDWRGLKDRYLVRWTVATSRGL